MRRSPAGAAGERNRGPRAAGTQGLTERIGIGRLPAAEQAAIGTALPMGEGTRRRGLRPVRYERKRRPRLRGGHGIQVPNRDEGEKGGHRRLLLLKAIARAQEAWPRGSAADG